jgi:hydroxyacylglutathione hydrolase
MHIAYKNESVTVYQSALYQTTATIIETPDCVIAVDPNWLPDEVETIRRHVEKVRGARPLYLLFTHADFDHIIGYRAFPDATVIASAELCDYPDKARKLRLIAEFDAQYYVDRDYPVEFPHVDHAIEQNGEVLQIGSTSLTFYKAPGHSHDGLFTVLDDLGLFVAGDYLATVEFPFVYHSVSAYEETMRTAAYILATHDISLLVPGHGPVTTSPAEMERRIRESEAYLAALRDAAAKYPEHTAEQLAEQTAPLIDGYKHVRMMRPLHLDNVKLLKKELGHAAE